VERDLKEYEDRSEFDTVTVSNRDAARNSKLGQDYSVMISLQENPRQVNT
jgi:hypothetical protein